MRAKRQLDFTSRSCADRSCVESCCVVLEKAKSLFSARSLRSFVRSLVRFV